MRFATMGLDTVLFVAAPCAKPPVFYRSRDPQASDLWRLIDQHFDSFQQVYDERYQAKYGYWRPIIEQSVTAYLKCGDLHELGNRQRVFARFADVDSDGRIQSQVCFVLVFVRTVAFG